MDKNQIKSLQYDPLEIVQGIKDDQNEEQYDGTYSDSSIESDSENTQNNNEYTHQDEQIIPEDDTKKPKQKKKQNPLKKKFAQQTNIKKQYKITMNVSDTQYPVVKFVGKKLLKWRLSYDSENTECDIYWTDNAVQPEQLGKMQAYQKINHFPGMFILARKNYLARHLKKMQKQFPEEYNFFPQTWLLPLEYNDLRTEFEKIQKGKRKTFIVKPEASCQGKGIFLTRSLDDLNNNDHYVVQRYLHKPFLIENLKFDFRVYVLLAGCEPLRTYIFKEGIARFATEEYESPNKENLENLYMHLTNYAINKDNSNFEFNQDENKMDKGHKRSIYLKSKDQMYRNYGKIQKI
ncbi:tubulin-tyrosine ligase family protein, putative [Ichthyophthirius multifiliis]|uniref:Tubulin-tyrosine ligase family protein, putative n=1 Tax=Ichthyophthirius multifiliis TaxID=5932 RepID=G0QQ40_ICHMU|nr:tubulin-tyrosine ligase family protein, putative [Ichthyophthirius multifiliis]EGR32668.1 tubulin-tyrosine ligase family protein, putative [Ichthyophthirius multifiliis]|eukprot:XP_004036654.1 tubulin-tyrosine ligase family protein, putative [Ichthyophthirius multifiliis]